MPRNNPLMLAVVAWLALGTMACGTRLYGYAPAATTSTSAEVNTLPAAEYAFPPDSPQGNVRLATVGIAEPSAEAPRSIHVRMVLTNLGGEPWTLEKAEQRLEVAVGNGQRTTELGASAARGASGAHVEVLPGHSATIDLFFPLPTGAREAADVPAFDALWTVHAGARVITTRTPFERFLASSPAQNVPTARYPYASGTKQERLPGTTDSRWPVIDPLLMPDPIPGPMVP